MRAFPLSFSFDLKKSLNFWNSTFKNICHFFYHRQEELCWHSLGTTREETFLFCSCFNLYFYFLCHKNNIWIQHISLKQWKKYIQLNSRFFLCGFFLFFFFQMKEVFENATAKVKLLTFFEAEFQLQRLLGCCHIILSRKKETISLIGMVEKCVAIFIMSHCNYESHY